jgi:hypothetical protein
MYDCSSRKTESQQTLSTYVRSEHLLVTVLLLLCLSKVTIISMYEISCGQAGVLGVLNSNVSVVLYVLH